MAFHERLSVATVVAGTLLGCAAIGLAQPVTPSTRAPQPIEDTAVSTGAGPETAATAKGVAAPTPAPPPAGPTTRWLGYQEVEGERTLPVLGTLKTRNRNWFVADRVPHADGGFTLRQHTCDVGFDPVLGVQVSMSRALIEAMPQAEVKFDLLPDGTYGARGWKHGWDATDLEGDGHPGATVSVAAPVCGGDLYVASDSLTRARAKDGPEGLAARIVVDVKQKILGASSDCLRQASSDTEERLQGWFRLVPAPRSVPGGADLSCAQFNRADFPGR